MSLYIGIILVLLGYIIRQWVSKYYAEDFFRRPIALATPEQTSNYVLLSILLLAVGLIFLWINSILIGIISTIIVSIYFVYSIKSMQQRMLEKYYQFPRESNFKVKDDIFKSLKIRESYLQENDDKNISEVDYLIEIGNKQMSIGYYEDAIKAYNDALRIKPDFIGTLINRGYAYMNMGNFEKAESDFTKAIELSPQNPDLYVNRGNNYMKLFTFNHIENKNAMDSAINDYTSAITVDSACANAYLMRGTSFYILDEKEKAKADFIKASSLNILLKEQCEKYLNLMSK